MNRTEAPIKRVGIWIRVSTEDQAQGESPEHHERRARSYAELRSWNVVEVYDLAGVSGKSVWNHPETTRMLADVKRGHISGLIFSKLARLARNTRELLDFAEYFQKHEADLVSLQEAIDTSTPAGRLFYTMIAAMAQWEREEIASRVAASVPVRAQLGKSLGGAAPFGYQWDHHRLVPDSQEAPVRRLLYELFAEHGRKKTVARLLNEAGHRTRNGSLFSDTTVSRLISDPTAKGVRRANYTRSRGEGKAWQLKPESEWVLTEIEPIVPEELWERCNTMLAARKADGRQPAKKATSLFAGVLYCACGGKMYVYSNSPKYTCVKCRAKIPASALEQVFSSRLKQFVFDAGEIEAHLTTADGNLSAKRQLVETLRSEREKVQAEMDKLYRLYLDDRITSEGFGLRNRPLETRAAQLDDEIPRAQAEADFLHIQMLSSAEVVSEAQDLYGRWGELPAEMKRLVVENIVFGITVGSQEINIQLCPPQPSAARSDNRQHNFRDSSPPRA